MINDRKEFDPTDDVLFKIIFGSNERKHITIDFLNAVLEREGANAIKEIEFPNVELTPQHEGEKFARVDIFAVTENNERVNIEIQRANNYNMEKRTLYYWAKMFLHRQALMKSQNYKDIKPAITVNVLNFNFLPLKDFCSEFVLYNRKNGYLLTNTLQLYFLEIPKLVKKPVTEMSRIEKWLGFFSKKFNLAEKEELAMAEPAIQDAINAAEAFLMNENEYWAYLNRQSAVMDYNSAMEGSRDEGRAEGLAEGRAEGKNQILLLVDELSKAGRFDDISKLNSDPLLVERLCKEFNIE